MLVKYAHCSPSVSCILNNCFQGSPTYNINSASPPLFTDTTSMMTTEKCVAPPLIFALCFNDSSKGLQRTYGQMHLSQTTNLAESGYAVN